MGGDRSKERGGGGFPAPNEGQGGVSKWGKEEEWAGTHLRHWGPHGPPLYSTINKNMGHLIFDVPSGPVMGFAIPIGPVIELREGGDGGSSSDDTSTTTTPLTTPLPWATHHVASIAFVAARPIRRG
jgi:hypothetical protein